MKKIILMGLIMLTGLVAADSDKSENRCGWISEHIWGIKLTDSTGDFLISSPTQSIFHDGNKGLIKRPKVFVQSQLDSDPVQIFCGCTQMTSWKVDGWNASFASVSQYQSKDLDACFKDSKLPSLMQLLVNN